MFDIELTKYPTKVTIFIVWDIRKNRENSRTRSTQELLRTRSVAIYTRKRVSADQIDLRLKCYKKRTLL